MKMSSRREKLNTVNDCEESDKFEALFAESSRILEAIYRDLELDSITTTSSNPTKPLSKPPLPNRHSTNSIELPSEAAISSESTASTSAAAAAKGTRFTISSEVQPIENPVINTSTSTLHSMDASEIEHENYLSTTPIEIIDLSAIQSPVYSINDYSLSDDDDVIVVDGDDSMSIPSSSSQRVRGANSKKKSLLPTFSTVDTNESLDSSVNDSITNEKLKFTCPICMERMINRKPTTTKCGHIFCLACIREAIRLTRKCPLCTTKLTERTLVRIFL